MRALLSDFLDRSLHWRTARSLAVHLAGCPPCAVWVASVETTILLYRERPVVDVPVAVRGHLRELLRERHQSAPKGPAGRPRAADPAPSRARSRPKTARKPPAGP